MKGKLVAATVGAALVLAPVSAVAAAGTPTANWQIPLTAGPAYPGATGSAQYQSQPGQRELQIEVERLAALRGASLLVRVDGNSIGSMPVSSRGVAQLTRNTERGQRVPAIAHGSTVTVKTTTGVVISSGRF